MTIQRLWTDLTSAGLSSRAWPAGRPRVGFVHDLEAPPRAGLGRELINWAKGEGLSPHWVSDPGGAYLWLDTSRQGVHIGGGNPYGVGYEVTGYASWSRSTWLAQGIDGLRWQAYCMAVDSERWGFELAWGSLDELARLVPKYYTHNDSRQVFRGTTHVDPGDGYPYDIVMKMAQQWRYGTGVPTPNPNPQPGDGPGGSESKDWIDMATPEELEQAFTRALHNVFGGNPAEQLSEMRRLLGVAVGGSAPVGGEYSLARESKGGQLSEIRRMVGVAIGYPPAKDTPETNLAPKA